MGPKKSLTLIVIQFQNVQGPKGPENHHLKTFSQPSVLLKVR